MSERVYTNRGLINDIEANLIKVMQLAFERDETLRYLNQYRPNHWITANPEKIPDLESLPALYAWCDGILPLSDTVGAGRGSEMSQKLNFLCNIEYLLPLIEDEEAEKVLKEVSWILFSHMTENLNLYGLCPKHSEIIEMTIYPDIKIVKDKPRKVSALNLKLRFLKARKIKHATI
jgi:hypothetical protein